MNDGARKKSTRHPGDGARASITATVTTDTGALAPDLAAAGIIDDALARRNAVILAIAQALFSLASINLFTTASIAGNMLAANPRWATLPITTYVSGTALFTWPAAWFMQRFGRRAGFQLGTFMGVLAAALAVLALFRADFALFCAATFLQGVYQAFAQYYRFAAGDVASPAFRPKTISWVLFGAIAGALFGPILVKETQDLLAPVSFAGNFATAGVITAIAFLVVSLVRLPRPGDAARGRGAEAEPARPLAELLRQPRLLTAILGGMLAYGMMNLLMTATPLAMIACGFTTTQSAWVIQWHVLAMFAPSFITGALIARHGAPRIMAIGFLLMAAAGIVNVLGQRMENFGFGLVLLGLGWNFAFIAATTMVAESHRPSERAKVQGFNDLMVFLTVAATSLASGQLLAGFGWAGVNAALAPMLVVAALALAWHALHLRRRATAITAADTTGE